MADRDHRFVEERRNMGRGSSPPDSAPAPSPPGGGLPESPSFFGKASQLLMGSLDYESTLATVAGLALPELGSWSILDLIESGSIRRVAIVHPDPEMQILARKLQRQWPPETEDPLGAPVVVRTAAPQVVSRVTDKLLMEVARDKENLAILRKLGIESFLVVPLISSNGILGAITFISGPTGRRHTKRDLAKAQGLAAVSALAIEHARMHRESQDARNQAAERAEVAERQQR